jgi:hypothetical protein
MDNDERERDCMQGEHVEVESAPSVAGLNDSLAVFGRQLHVQTELLRSSGFCIATQVFSNGRVLFSRKSDCTPEFSHSRDTGKIQELMKSQHLQVIREINKKAAQIFAASDSQ